jgi:acyl-coenzyme A synthetase/AMP-(fatty) acid ligase
MSVNPLGELLLDSLDRWSSRPAIRTGHDRFTYGQLADRVVDFQRLARTCGLDSNSRLVYVGSAGLDFYAALLAGISGSFEVSFVSRALPEASRKRTIDGLRPDLTVADDTELSAVGGLSWRVASPPDFLGGNLETATTERAFLSQTSGTLGTPTTAVVDGIALAKFLEWSQGKLSLEHADVWLEAGDMSSDLSITNALMCLSSGAEILLPAATERFQLARIANDNRASVMRIVPAFGRLLLASCKRSGLTLDSLRLLGFGGDLLPTWLPNDLSKMTNAAMINTYGKTEAAGFVLYHHIPIVISLGWLCRCPSQFPGLPSLLSSTDEMTESVN